MVRNQGPPSDEESQGSPREEFRRGERASSRSRGASRYSDDDSALDTTLLDLEPEEQQPFLRAQKRVPVRRGPLPKKAANRLRNLFIAFVVLGAAFAAGAVVYRYGSTSWRFRLDSSDQIDVEGLRHATRSQVMQVMGGDIGRNIFFVPLAERKRQLEEIPWVESAAVMRFLPNRLKVSVRERTPVAFVQMDSHSTELIDANGVIMEMPADSTDAYSFPVVVNFKDDEPLSTRAPRMKIYLKLVGELDANGERRSQELSEVDVTDPDDVKVIVSDQQGAVLVHLGSSKFAERYKVYISHVQEWRQQYQRLDSVDLRYEGQIILNTDAPAAPPAAAVPQAKAVPPKAVAAAKPPARARKWKRH
jgi:cell division protein FtsQ